MNSLLLNLQFCMVHKEFVKIVNDYIENYGKIVRIWLGHELYILTIDPKDVEVSSEYFCEKFVLFLTTKKKNSVIPRAF